MDHQYEAEKFGTFKWQVGVFEADVRQVRKSDVVVAILDYAKQDEEVISDETFYPSQEVIESLEHYEYLGTEWISNYNDAFLNFKESLWKALITGHFPRAFSFGFFT